MRMMSRHEFYATLIGRRPTVGFRARFTTGRISRARVQNGSCCSIDENNRISKQNEGDLSKQAARRAGPSGVIAGPNMMDGFTAKRRDVVLGAAAVFAQSGLGCTPSCLAASADVLVADFARKCTAELPSRSQVLRMYRDGQLENAEAALVDLIDGCSQSQINLSNELKLLGDLRFELGRFESAVSAYSQSLTLEANGPSSFGAYFGRGNAYEGIGNYESAIRDYTASLELRREAIPLFERAQAYKELRRWKEAMIDYADAAGLFSSSRQKREAKIAQAQSAFAAFEAGYKSQACAELETLSRQLYSSDIRAALVACLWSLGQAAEAESIWLDTCQMNGAMCGKYTDTQWLRDYRKWTPSLAASMQDFLRLQPAGGTD